jgi:hypothetical protein
VNLCVCGKRRFRSQKDAEMVVLSARIARSLRNSNKRKEQRAYECVIRRGIWHVTSKVSQAPPPPVID